jgi:heme-degrading monooxygenase HmoA
VIVEYIRYRLSAHDGDALVAAYGRAAEHLAASPHALGWELSRCVEEAKVFVLRIEWDSADGHMIGFRKGAQFPPFLAEIRPFVGEIEEMRHYEVTPVTARKAA